MPAMVIVPAQPLAHDLERQHPDPDAVAGAQMFADRIEKLVPGQREIGGERLRRRVDSAK